MKHFVSRTGLGHDELARNAMKKSVLQNAV
jgi:hypothetical protein